MRSLSVLAAMSIVGLLCTACATRPPLDLAGVDAGLTPARAAADIGSARTRKVEWGGVIVSAENLRDRTRLEVLAYPLDHSARPELDRAPLGRFILEKAGYLETLDYAPGRLLTAVGLVTGIRDGTVGQTAYRFPLISAEQLHLWPVWTPDNGRPRIQFGFGVLYSH